MKRTIKEWRKLLTEDRSCQEPVNSFCQRHKITLSSYYYWRAKVSAKPSSQVKLLPVVVTENHHVIDTVELVMPKGMTLRFSPGASAHYVVDIIRALV